MAVDGRELEPTTVIGEAHVLDIVALDGGQTKTCCSACARPWGGRRHMQLDLRL
jgi:hypothetical protein